MASHSGEAFWYALHLEEEEEEGGGGMSEETREQT